MTKILNFLSLDKRISLFLITLLAGFLMALLPRLGITTNSNNFFQVGSFGVHAEQKTP